MKFDYDDYNERMKDTGMKIGLWIKHKGFNILNIIIKAIQFSTVMTCYVITLKVILMIRPSLLWLGFVFGIGILDYIIFIYSAIREEFKK